MKLSFRQYRILILFLLVAIPITGLFSADLTLVSSSSSGCEFVYQPASYDIDTLRVNNQTFQKLVVPEAQLVGEIGDPMLPVRLVVLGVPFDKDIRVRILEQQTTTLKNLNLLPVSRIEKNGDMPVDVYAKGASYKKNQRMPDQQVTIETPGQWREQRIVRLALAAAQYNPVTGEAQIVQKLRVAVDFVGSSVSSRIDTWQASSQEGLFKETLLNYESAKYWRQSTARGLAKAQNQIQAGSWYQIPISQDREGIYQITGQFLKNNNVDISSIDPATLKVYNNGGRELPRSINAARIDGWQETPIQVIGADDGSFDEGDYVLFYGRGVKGWEFDSDDQCFSHYVHLYTNQNIYSLVFNDGVDGKRMETTTGLASQTVVLNAFEDQFFIEEDLTNPFSAGIYWFGQSLVHDMSSKTYSVAFHDPVDSDTFYVKYALYYDSASTSDFFYIYYGDQRGIQHFRSGAGFFTSESDTFVYDQNESQSIEAKYTAIKDASIAYIDWIEIQYPRYLKANNNTLKIYSPIERGAYQYELSGFTEAPRVYDVTDPASVRQLYVEQSGTVYRFTDDVNSEGGRQYLVVTKSTFSDPEGIESDAISSLRSTENGGEMLIISHEDFLDEAERLKAHRESFDGMSVYLADIQDVYDEFNGGVKDPVAIRDFVKYAYDHWAVAPSYLLLVGDGDYDYRNLLSSGNGNWIPPYENAGTGEISARCSDDWFTYVTTGSAPCDLAPGRLPVTTKAEAKILIDKIIQYDTNPDLGNWRQLITMVGDDEFHDYDTQNETTHINSSELIVNSYVPGDYNLNKIYLTEYPAVSTVDGRRKPLAQQALIDQINDGTVLVNYTGHGNHLVWSDERIFNVTTDLDKLENEDRLPVFYASTCAWGWYDNPEEQSFAEKMVLSEGKGAVAVIAASRFCGVESNEQLNRQFIKALFSANDGHRTLRLGDAVRIAKVNVSYTSYNEMYHLFGDPAMRLGVPNYRAEVTDVSPDTLKALSVVTVSGEVFKEDALWTDFNGRVGIKSFDSEKEIKYETSSGSILNYNLPGNALYRGESSVDNGKFQVSFVVPKDISYGGETGKISLYFWNETDDGMGHQGNLVVGGSENIDDRNGPEISLGFTSLDHFISGDMVEDDADLVAVIKDDKTGVNIAGEIGHKLILTIDGSQEDITDQFNYDDNSYLQGKIYYPLSDLSLGDHEMTLKAWDNANNSSNQSIVFTLVAGGELYLTDVLNYPNPMDEMSQTDFTFNVNLDAEVEIRIFTVAGRRIRKLEGYWATPGFNQIHWDGLDEQGDALANGVYLYKVIVKSDLDGESVSKSEIGRLMMMR